MRSGRNLSKKCLDRAWKNGLGDTLPREILQLLLGRQLAEEQQIVHLLEAGIGRQIADRVPAVSQTTFACIYMAHSRFTGEDSLEPRAVRQSFCGLNHWHDLHPASEIVDLVAHTPRT